MKLKFLLFSIIICTSFTSIDAQKEQEAMIFKAMGDELKRSMDSLSLPGMQKPFFMAYTIGKSRNYSFCSTFGGYEDRTENPSCSYTYRVDLQVGDYHRSNINYSEPYYQKSNNNYFGLFPYDCNYNEIRRILWLASDDAYKNAAKEYDLKMMKWQQINVSPEMEALDDFSRITPIEKKVEHRFNQSFNRKEYWKETLQEVSSVFTKYKDLINGWAIVSVTSTDMYYQSSEGTKIVYPQDYSHLRLGAGIRTEDGGDISCNVGYNELNDADLPSKDSLIRAAEKIAQLAIALKNAPKVNETYDGPVLFEGLVVAYMFHDFLYEKTGMTGYRTPLISSDSETMEDCMNRKILPKNMTVTSEPGLKEFKGKKLFGAYEVDAEGVVPPEKMVMVENGILRNVANGRIPTLKTPLSNGHVRPALSGKAYTNGGAIILRPGVVRFDVTEGETKSQLKKELIRLAIEEGYDYAYIVRGESIAPLQIYKVNVADGSEQLVRGAPLPRINIQQMKKIAGISSEQDAFNWSDDVGLTSIICPSSILLEGIRITKNGSINREKNLPVTSPLEEKQNDMEKRK
ncbi:MAG: metallopeptidase TldD-related protein [Bacteroidales bacterium]|nr:metallopeptidase TldD-related protein [Bacteroidales bacterium]